MSDSISTITYFLNAYIKIILVSKILAIYYTFPEMNCKYD